MRHQQLAAIRYYLRSLIETTTGEWWSAASGATNYATLVDRLEQWRIEGEADRTVSYATFNYDRLLELAIKDVRHENFLEVPEWINTEVPVYKLHGSIDWGRVIVNAPLLGIQGNSQPRIVTRTCIEHASELQLGDWRTGTATHSRSGESVPLFPAIAVPVRNKSTFSMPQEHLADLRNTISRAERILVIGWAGQDPHFLELLQEGPVERLIMIVAGSAERADAVRPAFEAVGLGGKLLTTPFGFSSFLTEGLPRLDTLLNAQVSRRA